MTSIPGTAAIFSALADALGVSIMITTSCCRWRSARNRCPRARHTGRRPWLLRPNGGYLPPSDRGLGLLDGVDSRNDDTDGAMSVAFWISPSVAVRDADERIRRSRGSEDQCAHVCRSSAVLQLDPEEIWNTGSRHGRQSASLATDTGQHAIAAIRALGSIVPSGSIAAQPMTIRTWRA